MQSAVHLYMVLISYAVQSQVKTRSSGRDLNVTSFNVQNQMEVKEGEKETLVTFRFNLNSVGDF